MNRGTVGHQRHSEHHKRMQPRACGLHKLGLMGLKAGAQTWVGRESHESGWNWGRGKYDQRRGQPPKQTHNKSGDGNCNKNLTRKSRGPDGCTAELCRKTQV